MHPLILEGYGNIWSAAGKRAMFVVLRNRSITEDILSTSKCIVEQTLNAKQFTPVSSDVNDIEALTPNHFLLGNKNVCLTYLPSA